MRIVFAGILSLALLLAPSDAIAGPALMETDNATETPRTYKGITEGDTVTGELTHYCVCTTCCGKTDGVTASGLVIANGEPDPFIVSCNWLPMGAVVEVGGQQYTVADRGGRGLDTIGRLDVFTPAGHKAALELGRKRNVEVKVVRLP